MDGSERVSRETPPEGGLGPEMLSPAGLGAPFYNENDACQAGIWISACALSW